MSKTVYDLSLEELLSLVSEAQKLIKEKTASQMNNQPTMETTKEAEFKEPRQTARKRKTSNPDDEMPISNKFAALENEASKPEDTEPLAIFDKTVKTVCKAPKPVTKKTPPTPTGPAKIPPIIITAKEKWQPISSALNRERINYTRATMVPKGIKLELANSDDYRRTIKLLHENMKIYFHTFDPEEERPLKVVLRGVIQELTDEEIKADLDSKGYPTRKITRLNGRDNRPAPLVQIELGREYKSIYALKTCCGLAITVEPKKSNNSIIQCHKCQTFGHTQRNCYSEYRCLKCGETHSTHLCEKQKTTPARCANCQGEHTSNSRTCPKNPNNPKHLRNQVQQQPKSRSPTTSFPPLPTAPRQTAQTTEAKPKKTEPNNLSQVLGDMFITFCETNPTKEQKLLFLEHTQKVIEIYRSKQ